MDQYFNAFSLQYLWDSVSRCSDLQAQHKKTLKQMFFTIHYGKVGFPPPPSRLSGFLCLGQFWSVTFSPLSTEEADIASVMVHRMV